MRCLVNRAAASAKLAVRNSSAAWAELGLGDNNALGLEKRSEVIDSASNGVNLDKVSFGITGGCEGGVGTANVGKRESRLDAAPEVLSDGREAEREETSGENSWGIGAWNTVTDRRVCVVDGD